MNPRPLPAPPEARWSARLAALLAMIMAGLLCLLADTTRPDGDLPGPEDYR